MEAEIQEICGLGRDRFPDLPRLSIHDLDPRRGRHYFAIAVRIDSEQEGAALRDFYDHRPTPLGDRVPRNRPKVVRELVSRLGYAPTADEEVLIDSLAGLTTVESVRGVC